MGFSAHVQSVQRISYPSSYGDLKLTFGEALKCYIMPFQLNPYCFCSTMRHLQVISKIFRILVKLVECAIESLGHGLQRIFYSSSYGDLKLTFCMDVQTTWKPKEFLMFPYVSLPKAAKIQMPSFLKNYAPKLSQNWLQ